MKFISMYFHQYHLQSKTDKKTQAMCHTKQYVLTQPFSFNYHLLLFLANYIPTICYGL